MNEIRPKVKKIVISFLTRLNAQFDQNKGSKMIFYEENKNKELAKKKTRVLILVSGPIDFDE